MFYVRLELIIGRTELVQKDQARKNDPKILPKSSSIHPY